MVNFESVSVASWLIIECQFPFASFNGARVAGG